jgi:GntR family transcriptional repressor for pyruvate dehydrogenase complex
MSHWDKMFHYALAACSRNEVLASFVKNANDVVMSLRRSTLADPAVARRSLEQHRRILEAVESRDAERAMQAVADHIASTRETISRLAKAKDGPPQPDADDLTAAAAP